MKLLVVLCLLAGPAAADPKPARVEITAKVLEIPKPIYYCGVIAYRTVVRFEVISVDKGTLADKQVFAVVLCPETIKVGQTRKLILERETKSDQGYVDKFPKTSPRWVVRYP
jgi:hypothetical protein